MGVKANMLSDSRAEGQKCLGPRPHTAVRDHLPLNFCDVGAREGTYAEVPEIWFSVTCSQTLD